ncbi:MAG: [LysW]-aminoadipate kinase [Chloroflexi bacterium]|nr:[LysW]-aminoadipate kinase [Chloroflexota bacterium]
MSDPGLLVVKLGGGDGLDLGTACDDLAAIARTRPLVVAHGVSAMMDRLCAASGIEVQTLTSPSGHSSRYTPPGIRDIYVRAAETANDLLVSALRERQVSAVGFVGDDVALSGRRKAAIRAVLNGRTRVVRDDHSGSITSVDSALLLEALQRDEAPVLPPMARSSDGLLNVDGDRAAAAVAGSLSAEALVILSNVGGLYRNFPDESTIVDEMPFSQIKNALDWAQGRMKRKVIAAQEALAQGVNRVIVADGRVANPVSRALSGAGTRFVA